MSSLLFGARGLYSARTLVRKIIGICALFALVGLLVVACGGGNGGGGGGGNPTSTPTNGGNSGSGSGKSNENNIASNAVGLTATNFASSTITIKKGESVILKNQTSTVHIISNGSWNGNTPASKAEAGAPTVGSLMLNTDGESKSIGPFNTAGSFHYYCSVHPGMNLLVLVQ